ncbi:hypothetical protein SLS64_009983 [Diaporthe eres]|uniref:Uncharacterized protein n=1 Tax=Diaporthe eres TaxID=83184 RepID=A0ABR1NT39_DIAER
MTEAARKVIASLSKSEKEVALRDLDKEDWRKWCNPEFILFNCGLRLEHIDEIKVGYIMDLVKCSLSEHGWAKFRGAMKTNKFLGEICARQAILNEKSYL